MLKGFKKSAKPKLSEQEIAEMRRLKASGWTYDMLAAQFECSHDCVSYWTVPGRRERKIRYAVKYNREHPEKARLYRARHRSRTENATRYQRRWRWSKKLKDLERESAEFSL